jgi:hypothetical protein
VDNLWEDVKVCFDTDDGSLPGVEISNLSPSGVSAVYNMLRLRSRSVGGPPEFWSSKFLKFVPVDSVADPAGLVIVGEAVALSHEIEGLVAGGVELPALGVRVWPEAVDLAYRAGREWGRAQIAGFFELLRDCCNLDSAAIVEPSPFGTGYTRIGFSERGPRTTKRPNQKLHLTAAA